MTSRLLLSGILTAPIVRRTRRDDGRPFGVATVRDSDRGEPRAWIVFVNDQALIETFEAKKGGEPIAIAGPFTIVMENARLVHRITADAIVGARKGRKKRAKGDLLFAVDPEDAPDDLTGEFNDPLPF
jgi:hypothetical protein